MEGTFSKIRNFFSDGIFGNIIRFLFDRFFGGIFTNNINFSNIINLKNCHFQNLTIDADKINKKAFKNGPFKLFSGKIGSISIKFPSLNALLTESLEVRLDRLDVLLVMNDVDFTKAEEEVKNLLAKLNSGELLQNIIEENPSGSNAPEDFDVYKKIINRILFNIKLKVENVCLRIVSEKPYKEVRLPIAPCFMLKIGKVEIKKNYDEPQNMMNSDSSNASPLNFAKHQDYSINIYGITMHMMANYELNPVSDIVLFQLLTQLINRRSMSARRWIQRQNFLSHILMNLIQALSLFVHAVKSTKNLVPLLLLMILLTIWNLFLFALISQMINQRASLLTCLISKSCLIS